MVCSVMAQWPEQTNFQIACSALCMLTLCLPRINMDKQGHGMQACYMEARLCIRACAPSASSNSYLRSHSLGRAQSFTVKQDQSPNLRCLCRRKESEIYRNGIHGMIPELFMFYPKQPNSNVQCCFSVQRLAMCLKLG